MSASVNLTHHYTFPPDLVWQVVIDLDHLQTVTKGLLAFKGLPSGQIHQGQELRIDVSLFGKMPYQPYVMRIIKLDEQNRIFQSAEEGSGVKSWRHYLQVLETKNGSRIEETIDIDAGLMSPLFATWARFMYGRRHEPRIRILQHLTQQD